MNGATALHTRAPCDECGDVPATREVDGGIIVCERCNAAPPANDDVLGSIFRPIPLCSSCSNPAFVRVDLAIILCAECWLKVVSHLENDSSFAAATPGENVTAAVKPTPGPSAAVTNISRECASRSSATDKEGKNEAAPFHLVNIDRRRPEPETNLGFENAEESAHDLEVRIGAAGKGPRLSSPERGRAAATDTADTNFSSGDGLGTQQPGSITWGGRNATPAPSGRARDRAICPAVSGNSSCGSFGSLPDTLRGVVQLRAAPLDMPGPQDSIPEPAKAGETSTVGARPAVFPDLRASVEPAAVELGCGQAPESNSSEGICRSSSGAAATDPRLIGLVSGVTLRRPLGRSAACDGPKNNPTPSVSFAKPTQMLSDTVSECSDLARASSQSTTPHESGVGPDAANPRQSHLQGVTGGESAEQVSACRSLPPDPLASSSGTLAQDRPDTSIATGNSDRPSDVQGLAVVGRDSVPGSRDRQATADAPTHGLELSAAVDPGAAGFNFDPEFDRLISELEVKWGWRAPNDDNRKATALRVVAASDSAENSKSSSVAST
jgi:ribosomal protein L37AE/L43A